MTSVVFIRHNGRPAGFRVSGHSGYAEAGEDILCAAISAAVQLTECQLNDVLGAGASVLVDEERADVRVELARTGTQQQYTLCAPALQAFEMFVRQLREEYTDYISISEE